MCYIMHRYVYVCALCTIRVLWILKATDAVAIMSSQADSHITMKHISRISEAISAPPLDKEPI